VSNGDGTTQPGDDPLANDPEVIAAEKAKRIAEAEKAKAEADKAKAEAEQAAEAARITTTNAERDARLAHEKAKAENDKAIADARSAAMKAWLPEPKTAPLEGTVDVPDGTGAVGRVAALSLLAGAAAHIAAGVKETKAKRVLVVDQIDLAASDWSHALVHSQLDPLADAAKRVKVALDATGSTPTGAPTRFIPALGAAATVVPALIGSAADVAGYFRSNYTIAKVDITATSTPLVAAVASELVKNQVTCYVDGLALFHQQSNVMTAFSQLLDLRWSLLDARLRTSQSALQRAKDEVTKAQTAVDAAKDQPAELGTAKAELSRAQDHAAHVQGVIDAAAKLEELIDTFATTVTTVAEGATLPPLGQAALRDLVHDPKDRVHVLALSLDEVGADGITRRRLFRSPTTTYLGAAHVSAHLLAPGGSVAMATTYAGTGTARVALKTGEVVTWSQTGGPTTPPPATKPPPAAPTTAKGWTPATPGATDADPQRPIGPAPAARPAPAPAPPAPDAPKARWTLMVFMAGMNNLAAEADSDLTEIIAGEPGGDVEVVVFVKQPTGCRRFRVGGDSEDLGDHYDSGDPNSVVDFVRWATTVAPADRYALVLWNHGSGWEPWAYDTDAPVAVRPLRTAAGAIRKVNSTIFPTALAHEVLDQVARQRAILTDDGTAHAVDTIELGGVTEAIKNHLMKNLDVLAMDACLMSNLEVAAQVRDHVEVIVGSEELEPGTGWHYTDLLEQMRAHQGDLTAEAFGTLAVDSYMRGYEGSTEDLTLCAVKAAGVTGLATAVDALAQALITTLPDGRSLITDCLGDSTRFDGHLVDLGHLCKNLIASNADAALTGAAQSALAALAQGAGYVLAERHSGPNMDSVTGVTIYLPASTDPFAPTYGGLRFSEETHWDDLLVAYRSARS
jgi:Clostripain family